MKKIRKLFKMKNFIRNRNDGERLPLFQSSASNVRDRSPSIDSISTNSSSSSSSQQRHPFRSYGSFLPNYFTMIRNSLRRSHSSQVRLFNSLNRENEKMNKKKERRTEFGISLYDCLHFRN